MVSENKKSQCTVVFTGTNVSSADICSA